MCKKKRQIPLTELCNQIWCIIFYWYYRYLIWVYSISKEVLLMLALALAASLLFRLLQLPGKWLLLLHTAHVLSNRRHENSLLWWQRNDAEPQTRSVPVSIPNKDGLKRDRPLLKIWTKLCVTFNTTAVLCHRNSRPFITESQSPCCNKKHRAYQRDWSADCRLRFLCCISNEETHVCSIWMNLLVLFQAFFFFKSVFETS